MRKLGTTALNVYPLCLGGNVFGWTADEKQSFAVLDAYFEAGGNFIDTADSYGSWAGNPGASETIIGKWMTERGNRDRIVVATKVGHHPDRSGLKAANIKAACDESLKRLQTDHIDVYFAHKDDATTELEETLGAFDQLVRAGKVRVIGASNYSPHRLEEALKTSESQSFARFEVLQPHYNLMERDEYEGSMAEIVERTGMAVVPYYALAKGFLSGKYRPGTIVDSVRAGGAEAYLDDRGIAVLEALDRAANRHTTTVAAIALAWLAAQPTITAPIASARTRAQVVELLPMARTKLSDAEIKEISEASLPLAVH